MDPDCAGPLIAGVIITVSRKPAVKKDSGVSPEGQKNLAGLIAVSSFFISPTLIFGIGWAKNPFDFYYIFVTPIYLISMFCLLLIKNSLTTNKSIFIFLNIIFLPIPIYPIYNSDKLLISIFYFLILVTLPIATFALINKYNVQKKL